MKLRRVACILPVSAGLMIVSIASASAAVPAFEFNVDVDGPSIRVTVDFEPVPSGFAWGSFEASGVLDELVGLFRADAVDDRGRPLPGTEPILLSLERGEVGIYHGSAVVSDGRWAVVAWPFVPDFDPEANPGAAPATFVTVGGPSVWVWLSVGVIAAIVLAVDAARRFSSH